MMAVFTGMTLSYLLRFVHADLDWRKCISTFQVAINLAKRSVFFTTEDPHDERMGRGRRGALNGDESHEARVGEPAVDWRRRQRS